VTGHVILKGSDLMLSAERAEGAPEAIYGAECLMCEAESGLVDNDPKPVEVWALEHARRFGLSHGQFLVTTQKHWRVDRVRPVAGPGGGASSSVVAPAMTAANRPRRPGAHARPRGGWRGRRSVLRPLAAGVTRLAALLLLFVTGSVRVGTMPWARPGRRPR
jgi:hypothetical protein